MKNAKPVKRSSRVLMKFTISYCILMLVSLAVGLTAYTISLQNANRQVIRTNELALNRAVSEVECCLSEARAFAASLNSISAVDDVLDLPAARDCTTVLRSAIANLPEFRDTYGLVNHYFVFAPASGVIVDNRNAYFSMSRYYNSTFRYGEMSSEEFETSILRSVNPSEVRPATDNTYLGNRYRSLLFQSLLTSGSSRNMGRVLFYIDADALIARFQIHFGSEADYVGIYRADGTSLIETGETPVADILATIPEGQSEGSFTLRSPGRLVSYQKSRPLQATLIISVPESYVSTQLSGLRTALFTGLGIILIIGLTLTLTLLNQNRKPLEAVIDVLPEGQEADRRNGLWWLEDAVRSLTESQGQMEESIRIQRVALQNAVTGQLIHGGALDEEELETQLRHVGLSPEGDWFSAVYIRMNAFSDPEKDLSHPGDLRRTQLMQLVSGFAPKLVFLGLQDQNTCAVLYIGQEEERIDEAVFRDLYARLTDNICQEAVISVGPAQRSLTSVYHSFIIAGQRLEQADNGSWLLIGRKNSSDRYHFTQNDEQRLINLINSGKAEESSEVLDHIRNENFEIRNVTGFERDLLFHRIADTLTQAADDSSLFRENAAGLSKMNVQEFFELVRSKLAEACEITRSHREESSYLLLPQIYAWLDENYTDYDTCLSTVALRFGLTEKYLSAFFKEKSGMNFSNYLENLRLKKATELLKTTSMTVEEISAAVGYSSAKTFSRAYYRCMGQTPSQARS